jgi:hypothetical protein
MKLIVILALVFSTVAAAKEDCKAQCGAVRAPCAAACQDTGGAGKTKKAAADCIKKMCEMAVTQCEAQCGAGNGKKR